MIFIEAWVKCAYVKNVDIEHTKKIAKSGKFENGIVSTYNYATLIFMTVIIYLGYYKVNKNQKNIRK